MGQERQFSSIRPANTAAGRRVLEEVATTTASPLVSGNRPPKYLVDPDEDESQGWSAERFYNYRLLTALTEGTATLAVWGWSAVSETWHHIFDIDITQDNESSLLRVNSFNGLYVQVKAISGGGALVDAWLLVEHLQETPGHATPGG